MEMETQKGRLDVGSIQVTFSETGNGEPLVCLPGDAPGSSAEAEYAANLPRLAARFRVICLDLPAGTKGAAGAKFLRAALDELGLERCHLAGSGASGEIALRLAAEAPE